MAWEKVVAYFALNFAGFLVFNEIWKRIKKPPPVDYTTIPGLKCPELEETEKAITFAPGELIINRSSIRGCLDQFDHLITDDEDPNDHILMKVLKYLKQSYGNVSSMFIGPRYVVCLSGLSETRQLKKFWNHNAQICPWAFGSIILGDPYFWKPHSLQEWEELAGSNEHLRCFISFENQSRLVLEFPKTGKELYQNVPMQFRGSNDDTIRVMAFTEEIDIDGHVIPAYVLDPCHSQPPGFIGSVQDQ